MKSKITLNAGALYFALQLSVFIVLILSAFIGWVYLNQKIKQNAIKFMSIETQAREELITNLGPLNFPQQALEEEVNIIPYGLFEVYSNKKSTAQAVALVGSKEKDPKTILYLPNNGQSLYLGKGINLRGSIYMSQAGTRPSNLVFSSSQEKDFTLHYTLQESRSNLPVLSLSVKEEINRLLLPEQWNENAFQFEHKSIANSFFNPLYIIEINKETRLEHIELLGNIWIRATAPLTIAASAKIYDVIISAPRIKFEKGFNGRLQAFTSATLEVNENSKFHYPSVLWVAKQNPTENNFNPHLRIGAGSEISGVIGFTQKDLTENRGIDLVLEEKTQVYGRIYCNGFLSSSTRLVGSIYTEDIGFYYEGVLYRNHLIHGSLSNDIHHTSSADLPFETSTNKKILQWLY